MLSAPFLTDQEIKAFANDGYVVGSHCFSEGDAAAIQNWTKELAERPEVPGEHWVYHEDSKLEGGVQLINRIENMTPFHDGFAQLAKMLTPAVSQLLGEEAVLFKDKINFKMSGGEGFEPHQDSQAGWETYAKFFISVMVCIDEATLENGCLQMAKRSEMGLVGAEWEPLSEDQTARMEFVSCETKPGNIVYFDCYTPHMSKPNLSNKMRRLYFATFNKKSEGDHLATYYADKHKNYPPDIERETGKDYVFRV
ncbi:MAG: phytanoyl-CoA dioxygenase family protein [Rhodospirillales bacterium]|nr:phytanoyl-CoA dioxygenase family protein [Rhodospirillales bacterium]